MTTVAAVVARTDSPPAMMIRENLKAQEVITMMKMIVMMKKNQPMKDTVNDLADVDTMKAITMILRKQDMMKMKTKMKTTTTGITIEEAVMAIPANVLLVPVIPVPAIQE